MTFSSPAASRQRHGASNQPSLELTVAAQVAALPPLPVLLGYSSNSTALLTSTAAQPTASSPAASASSPLEKQNKMSSGHCAASLPLVVSPRNDRGGGSPTSINANVGCSSLALTQQQQQRKKKSVGMCTLVSVKPLDTNDVLHNDTAAWKRIGKSIDLPLMYRSDADVRLALRMLRRVPFFKPLADDDLLAICENMRVEVTKSKGVVLLEKRFPGDAFDDDGAFAVSMSSQGSLDSFFRKHGVMPISRESTSRRKSSRSGAAEAEDSEALSGRYTPGVSGTAESEAFSKGEVSPSASRRPPAVQQQQQHRPVSRLSLPFSASGSSHGATAGAGGSGIPGSGAYPENPVHVLLQGKALLEIPSAAGRQHYPVLPYDTIGHELQVHALPPGSRCITVEPCVMLVLVPKMESRLNRVMRGAEYKQIEARRAFLQAGLLSPLFQSWDEMALETCARELLELRLGSGQVVLEEGAPSDSMFFIADGVVVVTRNVLVGGNGRRIGGIGGASCAAAAQDELGSLQQSQSTMAAGVLESLGRENFGNFSSVGGKRRAMLRGASGDPLSAPDDGFDDASEGVLSANRSLAADLCAESELESGGGVALTARAPLAILRRGKGGPRPRLGHFTSPTSRRVMQVASLHKGEFFGELGVLAYNPDKRPGDGVKWTDAYWMEALVERFKTTEEAVLEGSPRDFLRELMGRRQVSETLLFPPKRAESRSHTTANASAIADDGENTGEHAEEEREKTEQEVSSATEVPAVSLIEGDVSVEKDLSSVQLVTAKTLAANRAARRKKRQKVQQGGNYKVLDQMSLATTPRSMARSTELIKRGGNSSSRPHIIANNVFGASLRASTAAANSTLASVSPAGPDAEEARYPTEPSPRMATVYALQPTIVYRLPYEACRRCIRGLALTRLHEFVKGYPAHDDLYEQYERQLRWALYKDDVVKDVTSKNQLGGRH